MAKKLKWNLILMSVLYLGLGIFLLMRPSTALNVVCYALGGVVLVCAAVQLVRYFAVERGIFQSQLTLISGIICLGLGAFLILRSDIVVRILPIVFGLFGMALFVRTLGFGDSIIAGSLTLALLVLPIVIRTTEEAMRSIDNSLRNGSYALGATKLQTVWRVLLPMAFPNIVTGLILSIGRVSGETAPILFTAAAYFLPKLPDSIFDQVMALPYHLYVIATSGTDLEASRPMAYGTALVLIAIVLLINLLANGLRRYFGRKVKTN